ncbi:MAG TPA: hypothetical protein ENK49_10530 [Gammaproteobacteria bacterium]|nr:hypothetical protein [Gammaproteobacteria bacterium]
MKRSTMMMLCCWLLLANTAWGEAVRTIGKIEADIDGKHKVWKVLYRDGIETLSASWQSLQPGQRLASIIGFESTDVQFKDSGEAVPDISGPGSYVVVTFGFGPDDTEISYQLPLQEDSNAMVNVTFYPTIGGAPYMLMNSTGTVTVNTIKVSKTGNSIFKGTFSGVLRSFGGRSKKLTISNGTFETGEARFIHK